MKIKLDKKNKDKESVPGPGHYQPEDDKLSYHRPSWR